MKCPACENDVPYGLSVCTRCGVPLPSAGGRPGPETGAGSGPANPKTEPLPLPDWDAEEKPPWEGSVDRYGLGSPVTDEPGPPFRDFGAPTAHPRPLEYDPAAPNPNDPPSSAENFRSRWNFGAPTGPESIPNFGAPPPSVPDGADQSYGTAAGPESIPNFGTPLPPMSDGADQNFGAPAGPEVPNFGAPPSPMSDGAAQNYGTPAGPESIPNFGTPLPPMSDGATQNLGTTAGPESIPNFGTPLPPMSDGATQSIRTPVGPGTGPGFGAPPPPMSDGATRSFGGPGSMPPPGSQPADWDQGLPPVADQTATSPAGGGKDRNRKIILLAGGIAAVVLLGGVIWVLANGPSDKESPSGAAPGKGGAAQQAAAVNEILKSGKTARGHLPTRLRTCDDVSQGVSGFQQVVRDRQQELTRSKNLKVDGLKDGSRLRQSMIDAYQSSLRADQAYLAWAREIQGRGCGGKIAPLTGHYRDAISANDKAGPAKRQVVALWKPIAGAHGLPTYVWNRL
jgi:hypothetical protein